MEKIYPVNALQVSPTTVEEGFDFYSSVESAIDLANQGDEISASIVSNIIINAQEELGINNIMTITLSPDDREVILLEFPLDEEEAASKPEVYISADEAGVFIAVLTEEEAEARKQEFTQEIAVEEDAPAMAVHDSF